MENPDGPNKRRRVVIVGGGFGGLHAARALRRAPVDVTLIDRRNFHLFQPLLYQVATGELSPANIAAPLRAILRRQKNVTVLQAEVVDFDVTIREVVLADERLPYDWLIVAAGSTHSYFGHDEWQPLAPGLKSVEDATSIRAKILSAFERAEHEHDPHRREALLTFILVGGGPTGVEMAGALSELSRHSLRYDFRNINPADAKIILVDAAPRILSAYPGQLSAKAADFLEHLGVTVRTGVHVTDVEPDHVIVRVGDSQESIPTATVLWTAGVQASPLAQKLSAATGAELDRAGRIHVGGDLSLPGHDEVFVIGDMARCADENGNPLPGVAPVAIQQGKYVARLISNRLAGKQKAVFHYRDLGNMATVGRSLAVAHMGRLKFAGFFAWLLWLFVHLMQLVQFENRVLVFFQWAWNYFTRRRTARLITRNSDGRIEE